MVLNAVLLTPYMGSKATFSWLFLMASMSILLMMPSIYSFMG